MLRIFSQTQFVFVPNLVSSAEFADVAKNVCFDFQFLVSSEQSSIVELLEGVRNCFQLLNCINIINMNACMFGCLLLNNAVTTDRFGWKGGRLCP